METCPRPLLRPFLTLFLSVFSAGVFLACLEIPEAPEESVYLQSVFPEVILEGDTSHSLVVSPNASFLLCANIQPKIISEELSVEWFRKGKKISSEACLNCPKNFSLPDSLAVFDKAKNRAGLSFEIVRNTPPKFSRWLNPKENDTLWGDFNDAFLFEWEAFDDDGDAIFFQWIKDGVAFEAGAHSKLRQSGFEEGEHKIKVIVSDSLGGKDTSFALSFFVFREEAL